MELLLSEIFAILIVIAMMSCLAVAINATCKVLLVRWQKQYDELIAKKGLTPTNTANAANAQSATGDCPYCGSPLSLSTKGVCSNCGCNPSNFDTR